MPFSARYEADVQLALAALQSGQIKNVRRAADTFNVSPDTLRRRRDGTRSRLDTTANGLKMTPADEQVVKERILELDSRGLSVRLQDVRAMADLLLAQRHIVPVGRNWPERFVQRHSELTTRTLRKYDYQRAKCEDPRVLQPWFDLVVNTKAKYGILDDDIYNFDESGFQMGRISHGTVVTGSERRT